MHELAIATSVLQGVLEHADGRRVTQIQLKVGHLRQETAAASKSR